MDQAQLAQASGLSRKAIVEFEKGHTSPHEATWQAIQSALEARGIVFTNGDKPGFYFDKTKVDIPS
ncbi:XRE family transcriptional regulator [Haliangium sp. UPWRP_2]|nr:XRE family transcriptional regulator [Haliangium sp. UPWRP_2]